jgi:hypothetical protein
MVDFRQQDPDAMTYADVSGPRSYVREKNFRRRAVGIGREELVFHGPAAVKAELVRQHGLVRSLFEHAVLARARIKP